MQRILVRVTSTAPTKRGRAMARPYSQKLIQTFIIMKKFIFSLAALCMGMCAMAQSSVYVYQKNGKPFKLAVSNLDSISFTKPITTGTENGYAWVDLGLSVKWATCNLGATKPEEYGNYYAWGETATKDSYTWETYTLANGSSTTLTKYCYDENYGTVDNKTTLEVADDAATYNWGGNWRIPTIDECQELIDNCIWTWTDNYNNTGVAGYIVTSKSNDESIFLPAAGYYVGPDQNLAGTYGDYLSSSLNASRVFYEQNMAFRSSFYSTSGDDRSHGQSVRAVVK